MVFGFIKHFYDIIIVMNIKNIDYLKQSKLLLVEDDDKQCDIIKDSLEFFVDTVIVAQDGEEALDLYNQHKPDIIFTDLVMPKLNGIDLVKKIRENDSNTLIVIMSAHANTDDLIESTGLSLVKYLVKPINSTKLIGILNICADELHKRGNLNIQLHNGYSYSYNKKIIYYQSNEISLTSREINFIELLLKHRGSLISKSTIEYCLWENSSMSEAALKNFISKLRKKIGKDTIITVASEGYLIKN